MKLKREVLPPREPLHVLEQRLRLAQRADRRAVVAVHVIAGIATFGLVNALFWWLT